MAPSTLLGVLLLLKGRRDYYFFFWFFGQNMIRKIGGVRRELDVGYIARNKMEGAIGQNSGNEASVCAKETAVNALEERKF